MELNALTLHEETKTWAQLFAGEKERNGPSSKNFCVWQQPNRRVVSGRRRYAHSPHISVEKRISNESVECARRSILSCVWVFVTADNNIEHIAENRSRKLHSKIEITQLEIWCECLILHRFSCREISKFKKKKQNTNSKCLESRRQKLKILSTQIVRKNLWKA